MTGFVAYAIGFCLCAAALGCWYQALESDRTRKVLVENLIWACLVWPLVLPFAIGQWATWVYQQRRGAAKAPRP